MFANNFLLFVVERVQQRKHCEMKTFLLNLIGLSESQCITVSLMNDTTLAFFPCRDEREP